MQINFVKLLPTVNGQANGNKNDTFPFAFQSLLLIIPEFLSHFEFFPGLGLSFLLLF